MYNETLAYRVGQLILKSRECTIQLIPESHLPVVCEVHDEITEVGLSKRAYLQAFKEAHTYWHTLTQQEIDHDVRDQEFLLDVYYCTFGYLLTTNENHSIILLHQDTFFKLQATNSEHTVSLEDEFMLMVSLLTSRLKRINKSSSLWLWLKKLSIMLIFKHIVEGSVDVETTANFTKLVDCTLKAGKLHFSNYYAANFLRWIIRFIKAYSNDAGKFLDIIHVRLVALCHQHLTDVSLWGGLQVLLENGKHSELAAEYIAQEYNTFATSLPKTYSIPVISSLSNESYSLPTTHLDDELQWLLVVKCPIVTPYLCMYLQDGLVKVEEKLQQQQAELSKLVERESFIYLNTENYISVLERVIAKYRTFDSLA